MKTFEELRALLKQNLLELEKLAEIRPGTIENRHLTLPAIHGRGFLVQRRSLPYEYHDSQGSGSFSPSVRFSSKEEKPVSECPPVRSYITTPG